MAQLLHEEESGYGLEAYILHTNLNSCTSNFDCIKPEITFDEGSTAYSQEISPDPHGVCQRPFLGRLLIFALGGSLSTTRKPSCWSLRPKTMRPDWKT